MPKIKVKDKLKQTNLTQLYEMYMRECKRNNLSQYTFKTYKNTFKWFIAYANDCLCSEVSKELVEDYTLYLKKYNLQPVTINNYLRVARVILTWGMEQELVPYFKIKGIKAERKIVECYSDEELKRILKKPDMRECTFVEYRTWALSNFLLGTGCRISSALALQIRDIDFEAGVIYIRYTKTRKQLVLPLSSELKRVLAEYLEIREGEEGDKVFCCANGEEFTNSWKPLKDVKDYNHARGVERAGLHLYRHTFAKKWILAGGDMFRLQKLLGHSSIATTQRYVNMLATDLQEGYDEINPLNMIVNADGGNKKRKKITVNKNGKK